MTSTRDAYRSLSAKPLGSAVFSAAFMLKAPYFASVRPQVLTMQPHLGAVRIRKRRAVLNHIGTIHAIAVANGLEAAMGLLCEATVPAGLRWIPKGIELEYLAPVPSDVICIATTTEADWSGSAPFTASVHCRAVLADGSTVVAGTIPVWVSPSR